MKLGMHVGLGPVHIMLDRDPAPLPPKGRGRSPPPQFSAHVHCGQTAGWIKMALAIEVGLGPGYIVPDWAIPPLPPKGGGTPSPILGPFLLWPNGCMHQSMALGLEVGLSPDDLCYMRTQPPFQKGAEPPPQFSAMSIVAKRLDESRWNLAWRWVLVHATLC